MSMSPKGVAVTVHGGHLAHSQRLTAAFCRDSLRVMDIVLASYKFCALSTTIIRTLIVYMWTSQTLPSSPWQIYVPGGYLHDSRESVVLRSCFHRTKR